MYQILLISIVILASLLIFLVLMQQGKGADAGAAFGGGASGSVFGASGAGNFLTKTTWTLAFLFFINCLALAWFISNQASGLIEPESVIDRAIEEGVIQDLPTVPGAGAAGLSDLPGAAAAVPSDLPNVGGITAPSVSVDTSAGQAINVDIPVTAGSVESATGGIITGVSESVESATSGVVTGVSESIESATGAVTEGVGSAVDAASDAIGGSLDGLNSEIPSQIIAPEIELPGLPEVE